MSSFKSKKYITPKRLGLKFDPPTIIIEYMDDFSGKLYHHKMKCLQLQQNITTQEMIQYLQKRHPKFLGDDKVSEKQLEDLIQKLKKKLNLNSNLSGFYTNTQCQQKTTKINFSNTTIKKSEVDEIYGQYKNVDLNKLDSEQLNKEKSKMDVLFNKNNLKPGDPGFVYDKVEEFEPTEDNEWDD